MLGVHGISPTLSCEEVYRSLGMMSDSLNLWREALLTAVCSCPGFTRVEKIKNPPGSLVKTLWTYRRIRVIIIGSPATLLRMFRGLMDENSVICVQLSPFRAPVCL